MLKANAPGMTSVAQHAGRIDAGSTMIEENVVKEAGASSATSEEEMRGVVERGGFRHIKHATFYGRVPEPGISAEDVQFGE